MLVINKQQLRVLEQRYDELPAMMARLYPDVAARLGDVGTRRRVESGIRSAQSHGIQEPANVERFVHLLFLVDTDQLGSAPETEWAANILSWPNADEYLKLSALEKHLRDEQIARLR